MHRVQALIHPDNAASIRLAEGLGFRCEGGPLRDYWRIGDRYAGVMMYGLLAGGTQAQGLTRARGSRANEPMCSRIRRALMLASRPHTQSTTGRERS